MNQSMSHMAVTPPACTEMPPGAARSDKLKRAAKKAVERGMATAEYAVGILAAVALALVLIKVFNAGSFLDTIAKMISSIFSKILGWLP